MPGSDYPLGFFSLFRQSFYALARPAWLLLVSLCLCVLSVRVKHVRGSTSPLTSVCSSSIRYFFAVLVILTMLGVLNGLVLLPVLLSLMGPPAESPAEDTAICRPVPSPEPLLPPAMTHHGHYKGHPSPQSSSCQQPFSESEYSEATTSGVGENCRCCDSSQFSPTSDILLEASENPSFPKLKVSCNPQPPPLPPPLTPACHVCWIERVKCYNFFLGGGEDLQRGRSRQTPLFAPWIPVYMLG